MLSADPWGRPCAALAAMELVPLKTSISARPSLEQRAQDAQSRKACTAAPRAIAEQFTSVVTAEVTKLRVGSGLNFDSDVGALLNPSVQISVSDFVYNAVRRGAELRLRGPVPPGPGVHHPPTALFDFPEEPGVAIELFDHEDDLVDRANCSDFALAGTKELKRGLRACENAWKLHPQAWGSVANRGTLFVFLARAPISGPRE